MAPFQLGYDGRSDGRDFVFVASICKHALWTPKLASMFTLNKIEKPDFHYAFLEGFVVGPLARCRRPLYLTTNKTASMSMQPFMQLLIGEHKESIDNSKERNRSL